MKRYIIVDDRPDYIKILREMGVQAYLINFGSQAIKNNGQVDDKYIIQNLMELNEKYAD
jgi:hypothetical protein